jgi:proteasome activator-like protein
MVDGKSQGEQDATEAVLVEPGEKASLTEGLTERDVVESVEQPAKVMRIGSMVKQLLEEVRNAPLDEASRTRLREIHQQSIRELAGALSPDLAAELDRMALPFDEQTVPSEAELRIAQAQLVGWLEGLFHGIQASLMAQQMAARAQLTELRQPGLPSGAGPGDGPGSRPGAYL